MIKVICIGKLKEDYLVMAVNDYVKRLSKYHKIDVIELKDTNIKSEGIEIKKHLNLSDYIISLDIKGTSYSSVELSNKINDLFINGKSNISFIIGGSNGLDSDILEMSNERISFSKLTFPHGLFRVLFFEQLYRCFKILNNEEYHK